jgi:hypothetical protein
MKIRFAMLAVARLLSGCASLLLIGGADTAAAQSVFYVTGSQFYEACWQRRAKENLAEDKWKDVEADTTSQAALWQDVLLS